MSDTILRIERLKTVFKTLSGAINAVDGINVALDRNETLGIVGESGCGKSVTARSVMRLVDFENGQIEHGKITFMPPDSQAVELTALPFKSPEMRAIRGGQIAMVFQEPMASFNPVFTIGKQMAEALRTHLGMDKAEAKERAIDMLDRVSIPNPTQRFDEYPHEFSGGMRQRAMIAMAISCDPELLIADEPTTALDVTIEAQILELLNELKAEKQMTTVIITHDMSVIGEMTDNVMVMYAGRLVEYADSKTLFTEPLHPYTKALLKSIPRIGVKEELYSIEGSVPSLLHLPKGCYFAPRCPFAMDHCRELTPPTFEPQAGHRVRCWLYGKPGDGTEVEAPPDAVTVHEGAVDSSAESPADATP